MWTRTTCNYLPPSLDVSNSTRTGSPNLPIEEQRQIALIVELFRRKNRRKREIRGCRMQNSGMVQGGQTDTQHCRACTVNAEEDYDAFCLAYMFTYRDFEMGTLGLAWTGDLKNAGGVCEKNGCILMNRSMKARLCNPSTQHSQFKSEALVAH
uniref:Uncharacterized protein n=1 Tax=Anopheles culicifacies TaxID=139723 RepID=A0A182MP02_9DIPT